MPLTTRETVIAYIGFLQGKEANRKDGTSVLEQLRNDLHMTREEVILIQDEVHECFKEMTKKC